MFNLIEKHLHRPLSVAVHERQQRRLCDDIPIGCRVVTETFQSGVECRAKCEQSLRYDKARKLVLHQQLTHALGDLNTDRADSLSEVGAPPVALRHERIVPAVGGGRKPDHECRLSSYEDTERQIGATRLVS